MFNFSVLSQNFWTDRFSLKFNHVDSAADLLIIPMCWDPVSPADNMVKHFVKSVRYLIFKWSCKMFWLQILKLQICHFLSCILILKFLLTKVEFIWKPFWNIHFCSLLLNHYILTYVFLIIYMLLFPKNPSVERPFDNCWRLLIPWMMLWFL